MVMPCYTATGIPLIVRRLGKEQTKVRRLSMELTVGQKF